MGTILSMQPQVDDKDEANVGTIVGIVIGVLLLLIAVTICVVFMYKQKYVHHCMGCHTGVYNIKK